MNSPPTKRRIPDLDNNVLGILNLRDRPPLNCNLQLALEHHRLHGTISCHLGLTCVGCRRCYSGLDRRLVVLSFSLAEKGDTICVSPHLFSSKATREKKRVRVVDTGSWSRRGNSSLSVSTQ